MVKLNNISNDNPKAFWELINKLKHEDKDDKASNIDPSTWEDYLKNFNNLQSSKADLDKKFLSNHWLVFFRVIILALIFLIFILITLSILLTKHVIQ